MTSTTQKIPAIREQTLEHIARHLGDHGSGPQIIGWLKSWGVPDVLVEYPNTKWRMVYSVLSHYAHSTEKENREMLFKIIGEMLHPLMFGGDKKAAETTSEDFNKYLEYDDLVAIYIEDDKKFEVWDKKRVIEVPEEDVLNELNQELFEHEQEELASMRLPENREKISTLRKAYQVLMNITEVFCENPSKPSHELNDAYIKTKGLVTSAITDLHFYVSRVNGVDRIHKLSHYFIPFNNLFGAEKEYVPDPLGLELSDKQLTWDYIRPRMNATYGEIDEFYRKVEGSEILSKPDVQQTLNDVSLLLSKTREENKKQKEVKQRVYIPKIPIQRIEITAMPELQVRNAEENTLSKGKKRIHLPKFKPTDWAKITIRFLDERNVLIKAGEKEQVTADYETLGFADDRKDKPNTIWIFLLGLAKNEGKTKELPTPIPQTIRQQKTQLSNRLKAIFKNDTEPFYDPTESRVYQIKISLIPPQLDNKKDDLGVQEYLKETMIEKYDE